MSIQDQSPAPALFALESSRLGVTTERASTLNAKRALDLVISLTAIVFLLPVFALVTLLVALESPGPVLFCQRRIGRGGKPFGILKFRSMKVLEDGAKVVQATQNDPRITRVGRFLRASSLDELPQLFNVLWGEMSLVGPRPHAVVHDEYYSARISGYALRYSAKPGITGWAQVNGARGETRELSDMQRRIDFDAWYVEHVGLALDLLILGPNTAGSDAQEERPLMRSVPALPPQFEIFRAPTRPANDGYAEITVGGVRTACLSRDELTRLMLADCLAARDAQIHPPKLIFASNGHAIALAAQDENFRATLEKADIIHADGQAAVFASRLLTRTPVPERSATTDFIHDAAKAGAENGLRFFLLGATEEANAAAARILAETYPGLIIVGRRHGYFGEVEEDEICDEINLTQPDVIWVGLSVPLEYEFAVRNKARLKAGWLVTCGGCFNFVTGAYKRAPAWMQAAGLEWLFRLAREPKRLFWRYAVTNPLAIFLLLTRTNTDLQTPAEDLPVSQALAA